MISTKKARTGLVILLVLAISLFLVFIFFKDPLTSYLDKNLLNPSSNQSIIFTPTIKPVVEPKIITNKSVSEIILQEEDIYTRTYPYLLHGVPANITFSTSKTISQEFKNKSRSITYTTTPPTTKDFLLKNIDDSQQYTLLKPFID